MPESTEEQAGGGLRSLLRLLLGGSLILGAALWLLYGVLGPDEARRLAMLGWERLQSAPPIAFFSIVLVSSLLPVPVSVLYATAGTLYGVTAALLWIAPTAMLANTLIYFICSSFLRPTLIRQVEKRGHTIPQLDSGTSETLLITFVRITPGIPYFFQNWILGLAGVELIRSLTLTLVIHMMYASGFVILGRAAFEGELGRGILAIGFLIAISIIARVVHVRLQTARARTSEQGERIS